ncbi:pupal cuticle protein G1A-like [Ctenocephalides felis]|uniref:pupal cuticle protein G1A-like n=1 Tax=Ctenocephalides felis TaxID=7515 RepID=UPI000E6E1E48|nr:pupal cuticle protein G1A-like [Ctenocephalides felis]XP_026465789.1 pupal cuticle protein G1A-like [Ctenocephalides felis]
MFKLVVLFALVAVAFARPGYVAPLAYTAPVISHYSAPLVVKSVPHAISHQSSTVVHGASHVIAPVVSHYSAPAIGHHYTAPVVSSYASPLVYGHHGLVHGW